MHDSHEFRVARAEQLASENFEPDVKGAAGSTTLRSELPRSRPLPPRNGPDGQRDSAEQPTEPPSANAAAPAGNGPAVTTPARISALPWGFG